MNLDDVFEDVRPDCTTCGDTGVVEVGEFDDIEEASCPDCALE